MTARELLARLQHFIKEVPECADRPVKVFGERGRVEIDDVDVSITNNVWLIEK